MSDIENIKRENLKEIWLKNFQPKKNTKETNISILDINAEKSFSDFIKEDKNLVKLQNLLNEQRKKCPEFLNKKHNEFFKKHVIGEKGIDKFKAIKKEQINTLFKTPDGITEYFFRGLESEQSQRKF